MAGNGPAPKKQRQRRGTPTRGDWVQLAPLDKPILPELSELPCPVEDGDWPYICQTYWEAWRESPVTQMWRADDKALAIDTIFEFARMQAGERSANSAELRIRIESLGLSTKGRQDRRWLLPDEEVPVEEPVAAAPEAPIRVLPEAI
jgi:hypothetical protein